MSVKSAYTLRARPDATTFRQAWDVALDYAIRRLGDAALSRALHGVSRPVFYKGEMIGERRHYDERLTMFLLRYRDPVRFGAWLDGMEARRHPDGTGIVLAHALNSVLDAAHEALAREEEGVEPDNSDPCRSLVGPPLSDGPQPTDTVPTPVVEGGDCLDELRESLRIAREDHERDGIDDPYADDWRAALPVHRPRRSPLPDVP